MKVLPSCKNKLGLGDIGSSEVALTLGIKQEN